MKACIARIPSSIWAVALLPVVLIAYPVLHAVIPAILHALVPEVVRNVIRFI